MPRHLRTVLSLSVLLGWLVATAPPFAHADARGSAAVRAEARHAVEEGRLEDAYRALSEEAEQSDEPGLLLDLAEAAGHLRLDDVALLNYRAFLEAAPESPRRREIEARIDALVRAHTASPDALRPAENYVVDWHGQPIVRRPRADAPVSELVSWDGVPMRATGVSAPRGGLAVRLARPY